MLLAPGVVMTVPGPVSWKLVGYRLVGYLSAGNYLQDLTRDRAADGGNWNDRIDQIAVC